jgi:hypothetical protein
MLRFITILFAILIPLLLGKTSEPPTYPDGVYCSPHGVISGDIVIDPEHPCSCERMNYGEDCDDPSKQFEDPVCNQYCHKDKCACPVTCDPSKH